MGDAYTYPFQRSAVGESSGSTLLGKARDEQPFEPFAGKLRQYTKAERRIRGEIACAECRRLKIKCDRSVPCTTCVKRGCAALCPNGTIPPGEGSRFVLAATDHFRDKMSRLEARMRCLEDALSIIHTSYSDKPHPLLAGSHDDLFDDDGPDPQQEAAQSRRSPEIEDPLGTTLLVDSEGGSHFFGPSGASESLLLSQETQLPSSSAANGPVVRQLDPSYFPPAMTHCYRAFPFTPANVPVKSVQASLELYLPPVNRATALCNIFNEQLRCLCAIVSRQDLVDELIPMIYKQSPGEYGPHELAMLFVVLAMGSLVDLSLPPYNLEAQHYYYLARTSLSLQPIIGQQSMSTAKALHLMSIYNCMSGNEANLEQSYVLLDLAGQVAVRIGLHVDPSSWGIQGSEAYSRRVYFWHLMSGVLWRSLITGRPPGLLTSCQVDCRVPSVEEENAYMQENLPAPYTVWGYRAVSKCLMPLARAILAVKPPSYDTILDLDEKVRELPSSGEAALQTQSPHTEEGLGIFTRCHYKDLMLLFLHRAYFAKAMSVYSENPLDSPYGHSVRAAYSSGCVVLRDTRDEYSKNPLLCERIWRIWSFSFTAAMIVGTMAVRGVHLKLEPPALQELEFIAHVFESAAQTNTRAARASPILNSMLQKARAAHEAYQSRGVLPTSEFGEELSVLSGHPSPRSMMSSRTTPSQETDRTPRQADASLGYNLSSQPPQTFTNTWHSRAQSDPGADPQQQRAVPASTSPLVVPGGFRGGPQLHQTFVNLTGSSGWGGRAGGMGPHYAQPGPSYQDPASQLQAQPQPQCQPQASPALPLVNIATGRIGGGGNMVPQSDSESLYSSPVRLLQTQSMQNIASTYHHQAEYGVRHQPYPYSHRPSSTLEGRVENGADWGVHSILRRSGAQP